MRYLILILLITTTIVSRGQTQAPGSGPFQNARKKVNSVNRNISTKTDSLTLLREQTTQLPDTIKAKKLADSARAQQRYMASRIDSIKMQLSLQSDSIRSLKVPDTLLLKQYASMQAELDSLKQKVTPDFGINGKADSITRQLNTKVENVSGRLEKLTKRKVKIPSAQAGNIKEPSFAQVQIPGMQNVLSDKTPGVPVGLPALPDTQVNMPNVKTNLGAGTGTKTSPGLPDSNIPEISQNKSLAEVQQKTGQLGEISSGAKAVPKNLTSLKQTDLNEEELAKKTVNKLSSSDQAKQLTNLPANPAVNWNDPEVAKEMVFNKSKEQAMNHFAGHEKEIMAALDEFAKIRSQIKRPEGTIDMLNKHANTQKEKKFYERLIPALTLQLQKPDAIWLDVNPSLGYYLCGKLALHAGANYRLSYHKQEHWLPIERIYGPRASVEFLWREFFSIVGQVDLMNCNVNRLTRSEPGNRHWVWSYMIGTKASYKISKNMKGNAQVLYNIVDPYHQSPYPSRLNMRIGMEFKLTKR